MLTVKRMLVLLALRNFGCLLFGNTGYLCNQVADFFYLTWRILAFYFVLFTSIKHDYLLTVRSVHVTYQFFLHLFSMVINCSLLQSYIVEYSLQLFFLYLPLYQTIFLDTYATFHVSWRNTSLSFGDYIPYS